MDLAALQRYAPLLTLGSKAVGSLKDDELASAARALAGEGSGPLLEFFKVLRSATPDSIVRDVLGSPHAKQLLTQVQQAKVERENSIFCKCPECGTAFETELN